MSAPYDLAIVGGGIHGATVALFCARAGMRTVLFERGALCREASGVNAGTLTMQMTRVALIPYALQAHAMWASAREWLGHDVGVVVCDGLSLAFTPREAELAALMPEKVAADTGKVLLCPMPGVVKAISVAVGQEVKAGDVVARLDDDVERIAVDAAKVALQGALNTLTRNEDLKKIISRADLQDAQTAVETARLTLANAELNLQRRAIKAPVGGVAGIVNRELGFSIGGRGIDAFVGYADGGLDRDRSFAEQSDRLYGFGIEGLDFGLLSVKDAAGKPYTALKAQADTVARPAP